MLVILNRTLLGLGRNLQQVAWFRRALPALPCLESRWGERLRPLRAPHSQHFANWAIRVCTMAEARTICDTHTHVYECPHKYS